MKEIALVLLLACMPFSGMSQAPANSQIVRLDGLKEAIGRPGKVRVVNFWATWCAPCVKEIPLFERINAERDDVEVLLVSMDLDLDPDPAKVYRFMARRKIRSTVLLLDEQDPNTWIDQIEPSWSGALPATLVVDPATGKRIFVEKQLHNGDLEKMINDLQ